MFELLPSWDQVVALVKEPWVLPGIAYTSVWLGLIGLKLIYKKINVKPPLSDEKEQLFNYLQGLTSKVDGWVKNGDNSINYPAKDTRPAVKIAFAGEEVAVTLGAENLKTVLTGRQYKRLISAAETIHDALVEQEQKHKLNTLIASVR
jgi:hypothetical protein